MERLIIFVFVGIGAQLVDSTLGMAFGVTATTLLVVTGVGAAHASAAVHFAEVATTLASGTSHWGSSTTSTGASSSVSASRERSVPSWGSPFSPGSPPRAAALITSGILLAIGVYVMLRFSTDPPRFNMKSSPHGAGFLAPLGLFGGFIDASGGGGWARVTTSTLLSAGKTAPGRSSAPSARPSSWSPAPPARGSFSAWAATSGTTSRSSPASRSAG